MDTELFLKDVSQHVMEVIRDDGLYRHIRFREPGTMCMHFDLITWPGHLCYTGDMGTFVFQRLPDMLEFFRHPGLSDGRLYINTGYWSEKLISCDCNGSNAGASTEFDPDKFSGVINDLRVEWVKELYARVTTKAQRRDLWEAVGDIIAKLDDGDGVAMSAAHEFYRKVDGKEFYFEDLWDYDFTKYTRSFMWCCYAISWGVRQYDATMQEASND